MSQEKKSKPKSEEAETEEVEAKDVKDEDLDEAVDSILDEIDGVLEENAAEFVNAFVQQGGQ